MTRIQFTCPEMAEKIIGGNFRLLVEGHAHYAPKGQDIICSAISALTFTLIQYLNSCGIRYKVKRDDEKGIVDLSVSFKSQKVKDAFDFVMIGYQSIADTYPEFVECSKVYQEKY